MCWRRYPPLSISLPFLAVGALPMMTTCQRAIRGSAAALQPSRAGPRLIRSEQYFVNPAVSNVNSEVLTFNRLTAADVVTRKSHSPCAVINNQPAADIELHPRGAAAVVSRSLWGFAGLSGRARRSWPEHGGSSLLLSLLAAPAERGPPGSPPFPQPPQKKTAIPRAGMQYSHSGSLPLCVTEPSF